MENMIEEKENKLINAIHKKLKEIKLYKTLLINLINVYDPEDEKLYQEEFHLAESQKYMLESLLKEVNE